MRDDPSVSDLVARARDGDESAWRDIVRKYAALVWAICRQYGLSPAECEDVSQGVWLELVEALPRLREPAALPGWLATTTRRECIRVGKLARGRASREVRKEVGDVADENLPGVADRLLADEVNAVLRTAFAQLEPHCQQLLVLLTQTPRLPYTEISERLDMPVGSIGPTRARCLAKLRQCPALATWINEHGEGRG